MVSGAMVGVDVDVGCLRGLGSTGVPLLRGTIGGMTGDCGAQDVTGVGLRTIECLCLPGVQAASRSTRGFRALPQQLCIVMIPFTDALATTITMHNCGCVTANDLTEVIAADECLAGGMRYPDLIEA